MAADTPPDVPEELRNAAIRGMLRLFVGAGVSRLVGGPNWAELADAALKHFVESKELSHAEWDQLKDLPPRTKLTLARVLEKHSLKKIDYKKLTVRGGQESDEKSRRLFSSIEKLSKTIVTTNFDDWLDRPWPPLVADVSSVSEAEGNVTPGEKNIVFQKNKPAPDLLSTPNTVIHLHGSLEEPENMILSSPDYLQHYANDRGKTENSVLTFLKFLFGSKYTVLFVGHGLEELEILEYILTKSNQSEENKKIKHYILQGFFSHQEHLRKHLTSYYKEIGIELVPFSLDRSGWDGLIDVLAKWVDEIPAKDQLEAEKLIEMEGWLDD